MQIVVLGMHRSGTSSVTNVIAAMGAYVGEEGELLDATEANPRGHWERRDVYEVSQALLRQAGADWWRVSNFNAHAIAREPRDEALASFTPILDELDAHRPWVLKDPRLCLLLPVFRPLLSSPVAVVVNRDPVEVALSLRRRDGFPLAAGLALWEVYVRSALAATTNMPRVLVRYADLVAEPVAETKRLAAELEGLGVQVVSPDDDVITDIVKGDLYRNRSATEDRRELLTAAQLDLATAFDDGDVFERCRDGGVVSQHAREVLGMFEGARLADVAEPGEIEWRGEPVAAELAQERATSDLLRDRIDALTLELAALRSAAADKEKTGSSRKSNKQQRALRELRTERDEAIRRYQELRRRRAVRVALRISNAVPRARRAKR